MSISGITVANETHCEHDVYAYITHKGNELGALSD